MSNVYLEQGATGENRWWRYLLTLLTLGGAILGFNIVYTVILVVSLGPGALQPESGTMPALPAPLFAVGLLSFTAVLGALSFAVRKIHRRPFTSLLGAGGGFRPGRVAASVALSFALVTTGVLVWALIDPESLVRNEAQALWPNALLFALLLPIQAATEELVLRGWLSQGVARLTRHRWVPVAVSSALFAGLHLPNQEISGAHPLLAFAYYALFGVCLSVVTLRTGRLELAMGIHTGWNLFAFLVASPSTPVFSPISVFVTRDAVTAFDLLLVPAVIGLTTLVLSRRRAGAPAGRTVLRAGAH